MVAPSALTTVVVPVGTCVTLAIQDRKSYLHQQWQRYRESNQTYVYRAIIGDICADRPRQRRRRLSNRKADLADGAST